MGFLTGAAWTHIQPHKGSQSQHASQSARWRLDAVKASVPSLLPTCTPLLVSRHLKLSSRGSTEGSLLPASLAGDQNRSAKAAARGQTATSSAGRGW